jgi:vacuolar-type H+-ATPase subunit H
MDTLVGRGAGIEGGEEEALRAVLTMERQAQGIIQDAEAEAQRIVTSAKQQAQEMKRAAEAEIGEREQAALQMAFTEIEREAQAIRMAADDEAKAWSAAAERHFAAALSYVLQAVTIGELDARGSAGDDADARVADVEVPTRS